MNCWFSGKNGIGTSCLKVIEMAQKSHVSSEKSYHLFLTMPLDILLYYKCMNIIGTDKYEWSVQKYTNTFRGHYISEKKKKEEDDVTCNFSLPKIVISVSWLFVHPTESNQENVEWHSKKTVWILFHLRRHQQHFNPQPRSVIQTHFISVSWKLN